jgi:hypothetical protein
MVRPRWKLEAERKCFCSSDVFKTYDNLWEGENKGIPTQQLMIWEGHEQFPTR